MAGDKSTRRRRLRKPPERVQRLLTFAIYAASLEVPRERRAVELVEALDWLIDLLHTNGYAAPLWLLRPRWYFSRGVEIRDPERERPTSHLLLGLAEGIFADLPEQERSEAMRELLHLFAGIYAQGGADPPEWIRVGLDRYAEDEGEELPPELMLDVLGASLDALPEQDRPEARRATLEHFRGLYAGRGLPVPEWVRVGLEQSGG